MNMPDGMAALRCPGGKRPSTFCRRRGAAPRPWRPPPAASVVMQAPGRCRRRCAPPQVGTVPKPAPAPAEVITDAAASSCAGGSVRIQLASVRSPEAAREEWTWLKRDNDDLLALNGVAVEAISASAASGTGLRRVRLATRPRRQSCARR